MAKKMLIEATHTEEVRVAIVDGERLEEFESESATKKQLKGNIYLAKVIRIEPSLQAAFVEFGGNRHGFLPFSEIHSDYYRIPVADRHKIKSSAPISKSIIDEDDKTFYSEQALNDDSSEEKSHTLEIKLEDDIVPETKQSSTSSSNYKIQEVIKPRQIMLIQVVKEERGEKGAALTTFLTLAGRYCVLMPNSGGKGGGISRKITDPQDRKRLKDILEDFEIPNEMSLIVRTAGQSRTKIEIKRDYDYLIRLWTEIRDNTFQSIAPSLIHSEGDLIKRSIRDIYTKDIEEILVDNEESYKESKTFMKNLIPSHAKKIRRFKEGQISLFAKYRIDDQIDTMMYPKVMLPSGGSIVINPTEALVSIDVNSGRSTKERHIDETAYKTNLEAADEIARQLRLRDIGGLIVIDFIDMTDQKYIQQVERRFKEAAKSDRARIQMGRIGQFGLLELSRQRLRLSLIETNTVQCHLCQGTGLVRSIESTALFILRGIEKHGIEGIAAEIQVQVPASVSLYILNEKRAFLSDIEKRYNIKVCIVPNERLIAPDYTVTTVKYHTSSPSVVANESAPTEEPSPSKSTPASKIEEEISISISESKPLSRNRRRRRNKIKKEFSSDGFKENLITSESVPPVTQVAAVPDEQKPIEPSRKRSRNRRRRRPLTQTSSSPTNSNYSSKAKEVDYSQDESGTDQKSEKGKKAGWLKRIFGES